MLFRRTFASLKKIKRIHKVKMESRRPAKGHKGTPTKSFFKRFLMVKVYG